MTKVENLMNTARMLEKKTNIMLEQARLEGEIPASAEKFLELMGQESFVKEFNNCASAEAVKELLDRNGVDFTMEEIDAILVGIGTMLLKVEENNGELTEEDLEQIAGGWSLKTFLVGVVSGVVGGVLTAAACVGCFFAMAGTSGIATPVAIAATAKIIGASAAAGAAVGAIVGSLLD